MPSGCKLYFAIEVLNVKKTWETRFFTHAKTEESNGYPFLHSVAQLIGSQSRQALHYGEYAQSLSVDCLDDRCQKDCCHFVSEENCAFLSRQGFVDYIEELKDLVYDDNIEEYEWTLDVATNVLEALDTIQHYHLESIVEDKLDEKYSRRKNPLDVECLRVLLSSSNPNFSTLLLNQ